MRFAVGAEPGDGFLAQVPDAFDGSVRSVAQDRERPRLGEQQVAPDEMRQAEVGPRAYERLDVFQRGIETLASDFLEGTVEQRLRGGRIGPNGLGGGANGKGEGEGGENACQRPENP